MEIREDRQYTRTHQWVQEKDNEALIGITDYAQTQLQAVVFVNLPEVGDMVTAGESIGDVESAKVVSEVLSPVSGTVTDVNDGLEDEPEQINEAPYDAWMIRVKDVTARSELLSAEEYRAYLQTL